MHLSKPLLRIILGLLLTLSTASYALTPLSFSSTPGFPVFVNAGGQTTVYYTLQNNTPVDLPLSISASTEQGQLNVPTYNPCGTQLAGNRSCTLPLKFQAPSKPNQSIRGQLTIDYQGRYPLNDSLKFKTNPQGHIVYIHDKQPVTEEDLTISDSGTILVKNEGAGTLQSLSVKIPSELSGFTNGCQGTDTLKSKQSCSITYKRPRSSTRDAVLINTYADNAEQSPVGLSIKFKGKAMCWGDNSYWQIGDGTKKNRNTPVDVSDLGSDVMTMTEGLGHTCALLTSGAIKCWGSNFYGQLANNAFPASSQPVDVSGLGAGSGVIAITGGANHTCSLLDSGAVKCWGRNTKGQLGTGDNNNRNQPTDVSGLSAGSGVIAITGGNDYTCALLQSGAVKCWGLNSDGQLGNGNSKDANQPVDVSGLGAHSGVIAITAGSDHTCALLDSGAVKCWGMNKKGQLGNGTTGASLNTPVNVKDLGPPSTVAGALAITGGDKHTCALLTSGAVKCWGDNTAGQLGMGDYTNRPKPSDDVSDFGPDSGVLEITAGLTHTCALLTSGAVKCWGLNSTGQLGNNSSNNRNKPVNVSNINTGLATFGHSHGDYSCAIIGVP